MAKTPYENLRSQLRERGLIAETLEVLPTPTGAHTFIDLLIYRQSKPPIRAVVIDSGEDGYSLFLEQPSIRIEADLEAIMAHDSGDAD